VLYHSPLILYLQVVYPHFINLLADKKWLLALVTDNPDPFTTIRRSANEDDSLLVITGWAST